MAKGDDALAKKKNKAIRKRNRRAGAGTTEAIEGVQAHKRRRRAGTRRVCEAMCYSLPTPEDPFLNRKKHRKNRDTSQPSTFTTAREDDSELRIERALKRKLSSPSTTTNNSNKKTSQPNPRKPLKKVVWDPSLDRMGSSDHHNGKTEDAIRAFQMAVSAVCGDRDNGDGSFSVGEFERQWWQGCAKGVGVLGSGFGTSCVQAYAVGAAPHVAVQRRLCGKMTGVVGLVLVNSKDQAHTVRQICKPLKNALNIHSICLHSDASVEHQVNGLAMQTPEIVIATPERLCELLSRGALHLSAVSYVVVDGLDDLINGGCKEHLENIRQQLVKGVQIGVISKTFPVEVVSATNNWLQHPIVRAQSDPNGPASSVCITQSVSVVTTEEAKLSKINKILAQLRTNLENSDIAGDMLLVVKRKEQYPLMKELLRNHKFVPVVLDESAQAPRKEKRAVYLTTFDTPISASLLPNIEVAINYDLSWPMDCYTGILTAMAASSAKGRVETLCSGAAAWQASELVGVLEACGQVVPKALRLLAQAAAGLVASK